MYQYRLLYPCTEGILLKTHEEHFKGKQWHMSKMSFIYLRLLVGLRTLALLPGWLPFRQGHVHCSPRGVCRPEVTLEGLHET